MISRAKVLIVGKGAFGEAIATLLYESHVFPFFYDKNPDTQPDFDDLEIGLSQNDIVFFAVPSRALPDIFESIPKNLMKEKISVLLSKGISNVGTSVDTFEHYFHQCKFAVMSGPMLANEIKDGLFSGATIATKDKTVRKIILELFLNSHLIFESNVYPRATALLGALKNMYAFGAGIIIDKAWGENVMGIFAVKAIKEMQNILSKKGYPGISAIGFSGLGDFIATTRSAHSCNVNVGMSFCRGEEVKDCEGLDSFYNIKKIIHGDLKSEAPILNACLSISKGKDADILLSAIRFDS